MKEIKFRAWSYEDEKMYYSPDIHDWDGFDAWVRLDCEDNDIGEGSVKIMQYTGLKDKKGKEIYEGDVIKETFPRDKSDPAYDGYGDEGVVEWHESIGAWS